MLPYEQWVERDEFWEDGELDDDLPFAVELPRHHLAEAYALAQDGKRKNKGA